MMENPESWADVEKSGTDELVPIEQTDESKSKETSTEKWKDTARPKSSTSTETKERATKHSL